MSGQTDTAPLHFAPTEHLARKRYDSGAGATTAGEHACYLRGPRQPGELADQAWLWQDRREHAGLASCYPAAHRRKSGGDKNGGGARAGCMIRVTHAECAFP